MLQGDTLARMWRALGRTVRDSIVYRVTLEREADADRTTYEQRAASLTDGLEALIRDASSGSFESIEVSRTAGPYSRTMAAINTEEKRVMDYDAWLSEFEKTGGPLLSRLTVSGVASDREKAARKLDKLRHDCCYRVKNTFAYRVSFAPTSPQTIEAIESEFDRLSTLDGVEAVELESDTPDDDPCTSIDFRAPEDR